MSASPSRPRTTNRSRASTNWRFTKLTKPRTTLRWPGQALGRARRAASASQEFTGAPDHVAGDVEDLRGKLYSAGSDERPDARGSDAKGRARRPLRPRGPAAATDPRRGRGRGGAPSGAGSLA